MVINNGIIVCFGTVTVAATNVNTTRNIQITLPLTYTQPTYKICVNIKNGGNGYAGIGITLRNIVPGGFRLTMYNHISAFVECEMFYVTLGY